MGKRMNSMMIYRGYRAVISYDQEDDTFIGEVIGINDSLSFYGNTTKELNESFRQSIENYLELCEEIGKKPEKEFKGTFNIRISSELHRQLSEEAEFNHITLNQHVKSILQNHYSSNLVKT